MAFFPLPLSFEEKKKGNAKMVKVYQYMDQGLKHFVAEVPAENLARIRMLGMGTLFKTLSIHSHLCRTRRVGSGYRPV